MFFRNDCVNIYIYDCKYIMKLLYSWVVPEQRSTNTLWRTRLLIPEYMYINEYCTLLHMYIYIYVYLRIYRECSA